MDSLPKTSSSWNLLGHEWAVQLLSGQIARGSLRHAYLITGPAGVGRRTLALALAQAVNCTSPPQPGAPCHSCRNCVQFARQQHPDLAIVQAEQVGSTLKVDQVRELQRALNLAPYQARYRIALILRFEEAHPSAANALLKTLEEPPSQVILILTAESQEALLPTVVSRCEGIRLRPLSAQTLAMGLTEHWQVPEDESRLLAHLSGGLPGYAHFLHTHPDAMEQRVAWLDEHLQLIHSNRVARFAYAEKISSEKTVFHQAIRVWISFWNDVLHQHVGLTKPPANLDRTNDIELLAERLPLTAIQQILLTLDQTLDRLDHNVNTRLAAEVLLLRLPFF